MDNFCEICLDHNVKIFPDPDMKDTNVHWCNTCGHRWTQSVRLRAREEEKEESGEKLQPETETEQKNISELQGKTEKTEERDI